MSTGINKNHHKSGQTNKCPHECDVQFVQYEVEPSPNRCKHSSFEFELNAEPILFLYFVVFVNVLEKRV